MLFFFGGGGGGGASVVQWLRMSDAAVLGIRVRPPQKLKQLVLKKICQQQKNHEQNYSFPSMQIVKRSKASMLCQLY